MSPAPLTPLSFPSLTMLPLKVACFYTPNLHSESQVYLPCVNEKHTEILAEKNKFYIGILRIDQYIF